MKLLCIVQRGVRVKERDKNGLAKGGKWACAYEMVDKICHFLQYKYPLQLFLLWRLSEFSLFSLFSLGLLSFAYDDVNGLFSYRKCISVVARGHTIYKIIALIEPSQPFRSFFAHLSSLYALVKRTGMYICGCYCCCQTCAFLLFLFFSLLMVDVYVYFALSLSLSLCLFFWWQFIFILYARFIFRSKTSLIIAFIAISLIQKTERIVWKFIRSAFASNLSNRVQISKPIEKQINGL